MLRFTWKPFEVSGNATTFETNAAPNFIETLPTTASAKDDFAVTIISAPTSVAAADKASA